MEPFKPQDILPLWKTIWKLQAAPRCRLLMWNIIFDKIPTGTNLLKRSFHGPFRCHICCADEESTDHLFAYCSVVNTLWHNLSAHIPELKAWHGANIMEAWGNWNRDHTGKLINLPLLVCWAIWTARNNIIFNNIPPSWPSILCHIVADFNLLPAPVSTTPTRTITPLTIDKSKPWAFFDGSAQADGCGGGAVLFLNDAHFYRIQIKYPNGTNNFTELSTAKHLIHFAIQKHCRHLQLFGDSHIVCNWLNSASHCHTYSLRNILDEAIRLISSFESFDCHHIYRELNSDVDQLSKEAAHSHLDQWLIQEMIDGTYHQYYHRPYIYLNRNGSQTQS